MEEIFRDGSVRKCPFCGGTEMIEAYQTGYGAVAALSNKLGGVSLYHTICRSCGSVVRSYVRDPEKLLKRRDRDYYRKAPRSGGEP